MLVIVCSTDRERSGTRDRRIRAIEPTAREIVADQPGLLLHLT